MKWVTPALIVLLAILAELTLGKAGHAPDLALFLGRFHPLVVHLPIGFFLLVALGEAATFHAKLRGRVEPALGLLIPVSAVAALGAFLMGQLLALEGGFPAGALGWHRRLTLLAVIGMAGCWVVYERQRAHAGRGRNAYRGLMGITLGLLSLGAHFGGTMTRGESYLSKYAPGPLKPLLGAPEAKPETPKIADGSAKPSADPLVYQDVLQPLLKQYCVDCHGAEKQKGKLRLDSLEALLKGGENGAVVVAGAPKKSPLLARMLLPVGDDDHMPPEGKAGPKPEALSLIEFWIDRGASPALKVRDLLAPTVSRALLEHALGGSAPPDAVPTNAAAPAGSVAAASPSDASGTKPSDASSSSRSGAPSAARDATVHDSAANAAAVHDSSADRAAAHDSSADGAAAHDSSADGAAAHASAVHDSAAAASPTPAPGAGASSGPAFLAAHCEKCHGAQKQKGKLRVDSVAALVKGGTNGAALVPGSPEQSSIIKRVRLPLADEEHMPPKKEPQPSAAEIAALVSWIRAGAGASRSASAPTARQSTDDAGAPARPSSKGASAPASQTAAASAAGSSDTHPGSTLSSDTSASTVSTDASASTASSDASGSTASSDVSGSTASSEALASANPSASANVAGPPDPALLRNLPRQVALFSDAVQPLLREKCGKCHIRDKPAGGLSVAEQPQLLEGGFSGAAVVPKDRKTSSIMQRLVLPPSDGDHMPPEGEPALSADEVELVGAWIDQGAPAHATSETAKLTAGAARALAARGIKGSSQPEPLAVQAGGCAACSVPGAPQSKWLGWQTLALVGATALLGLRRRSRAWS